LVEDDFPSFVRDLVPMEVNLFEGGFSVNDITDELAGLVGNVVIR